MAVVLDTIVESLLDPLTDAFAELSEANTHQKIGKFPKLFTMALC